MGDLQVVGKGVIFQWLGYFTDGKLKKQFFFDQESFEEYLHLNSDHIEGSRVQLHISGVGSSRILRNNSSSWRFSVDASARDLIQ